LPAQHDRRDARDAAPFAENLQEQTRDEWCRVFEGADACFRPVARWSEARAHEHSRARSAFFQSRRRAACASPGSGVLTACRSSPSAPAGAAALGDWALVPVGESRLSARSTSLWNKAERARLCSCARASDSRARRKAGVGALEHATPLVARLALEGFGENRRRHLGPSRPVMVPASRAA